jgi:hypothetical protein
MKKQNKITVKHYLNTNLKAYKVKNENFYSVYLFVTTKNVVTRVKSHYFNDLYSLKEFENFSNAGNENFELMKKEVGAVENIIRAQLNLTKEFDTNLFSLLYNHTPNIKLIHSSASMDKYLKNVCMIESEKEKIQLGDKEVATTISIYDFFKPNYQKEVERILREKENKLPIMENVNVGVLLCFFQAAKNVLSTIKKYEKISTKYDYLLNNAMIEMESIKIF